MSRPGCFCRRAQAGKRGIEIHSERLWGGAPQQQISSASSTRRAKERKKRRNTTARARRAETKEREQARYRRDFLRGREDDEVQTVARGMEN